MVVTLSDSRHPSGGLILGPEIHAWKFVETVRRLLRLAASIIITSYLGPVLDHNVLF